LAFETVLAKFSALKFEGHAYLVTVSKRFLDPTKNLRTGKWIPAFGAFRRVINLFLIFCTTLLRCSHFKRLLIRMEGDHQLNFTHPGRSPLVYSKSKHFHIFRVIHTTYHVQALDMNQYLASGIARFLLPKRSTKSQFKNPSLYKSVPRIASI
jgi:hypothetical protein